MNRLSLFLLLCILLASPALAGISPAGNASNYTPQRNLTDLLDTTGSTIGNVSSAAVSLTGNVSTGNSPAPPQNTRRLFWTLVVLFGGGVLLGWALGRPYGFSKFNPIFLIGLGIGLILIGVFFGK